MSNYKQSPPKRFLIIHHQNIGDLLCTTPAIHALRKTYPKCYIVVFANNYNAPILYNNPDIDRVEVYTKAKHKNASESLFFVYIDKLKKIIKLRKERFDYVIVAGSSERAREWNLARLCKPKSIVGYVDKNIKPKANDIGLNVPSGNLHEVEYIFNLFKGLGVVHPIPPMQLSVDWGRTGNHSLKINDDGLTIGIHISTRKAKQQWSVENFAGLIKEINNNFKANFLIFWSPGSQDNPKHSGDDEKAQQLFELCKDEPASLYQTNTLHELIIGLSKCQYVICSDGGGMHIAAALGKHIVCLASIPSVTTRWYPWGVKYKLLQSVSNHVNDISFKEVAKSLEELL